MRRKLTLSSGMVGRGIFPENFNVKRIMKFGPALNMNPYKYVNCSLKKFSYTASKINMPSYLLHNQILVNRHLYLPIYDSKRGLSVFIY